MPIKEKQKAVLGAIGIYVARTLASNGNPEIQPMNVSNPSAIVRVAQQDTLKLFAVDEYIYRRLHRYGKNGARKVRMEKGN